jgi:hypothetical protein
MADDEQAQPPGNPLLEKAGAAVTLLAAVALAWIAIDTLRPRREQETPDVSDD